MQKLLCGLSKNIADIQCHLYGTHVSYKHATDDNCHKWQTVYLPKCQHVRKQEPAVSKNVNQVCVCGCK